MRKLSFKNLSVLPELVISPQLLFLSDLPFLLLFLLERHFLKNVDSRQICGFKSLALLTLGHLLILVCLGPHP